MKICTFGAGAIGDYIGARLTEAGADVSLVAPGPRLAAMQVRRLTLIGAGNDPGTISVTASDNAADPGVAGAM